MKLPSRPWPYWGDHLLIAGGISGIALLLQLTPVLAGAAFYAGREVAQREEKGYWDWRGLLFPVVPLVALEVGMRFT